MNETWPGTLVGVNWLQWAAPELNLCFMLCGMWWGVVIVLLSSNKIKGWKSDPSYVFGRFTNNWSECGFYSVLFNLVTVG